MAYAFNQLQSNDLTLTSDQETEVLRIVSDSYDPDSPTEAYAYIDRNDRTTGRTTARCTETSCPAKDVKVQVHWHVNDRNPPLGVDQSLANLAREFPGPGDHQLLPHNVINVGVTPTGGVWAVERVGGDARLRYLRPSSNPAVDTFVQANWQPGMTSRQMLNRLEGVKF
jgi:hypothetical protein